MKILIIIFCMLINLSLWAEDDHDHKEEKGHDVSSKESGKANKDSDHKEEDHKDEDHKDEDHEEQNLPSGVTFFEDESGEFSLKENVIKNFNIETQTPNKNGGTIDVPEKAIVRSLKRTSIFNFDNGKFKSVPVKVISSNLGVVKISSEIPISRVVVSGNNFLQTILLSLEEGPSEGHGH